MRFDLKKKLFGGFGAVLALLVIATLVTFSQMNIIKQNNEKALQKLNQVNFLLEKEIDHWNWVAQLVDKITINKEFKGQLDYHLCAFGKWYYDFRASDEFKLLSPKFKETFAAIELPHQQLHDTAKEIIKIDEIQPDKNLAKAQSLRIYSQKTVVDLGQIREKLTELRKDLEDEKIELTARAAKDQNTMQLVLTVTSLVAIILGLSIAFLVNRGITRPVKNMVSMLKNMAESGGDLTQRISVSTKDEIGDLAHWFNAFMDKLHEVIAQVRMSAGMVSEAAHETSQGNQDLSQRTEEQASSLEEISSTIEEVTASLERANNSSNDAEKSSKETLEIVRKGETMVGELNDAMQEITKGSQAIAEIIAKVNDIAFQTNLLALNAAVEAARAGEQGRGFAVVAAEVRNLAGRTSESAKEVEGLIKESIAKVGRGNQLMSQTSVVLNEIVTNTQNITGVITEIACSMREQTAASGDIRSAVEQLNQVTQQNASLVEEIAGSSEAVSNEAGDLTSLVGQFKLREDASPMGRTTSFQQNSPIDQEGFEKF